jgi:hypothetical protein
MTKKMLSTLSAADCFIFVQCLKTDASLAKPDGSLTGKLYIDVIEAENLPNLDLLQGCASYGCLLRIFVADAAMQQIGFCCNAFE